MSSDVMPFSFNGKEVRAITHEDGSAWFVAKDICAAFGDSHYRRSVTRLDESEKGVTHIDTPGGRQQMTIVNEPGLYSVLFYMQPQKAARDDADAEEINLRIEQLRVFKRWVTSEVLPQIRKTGSYVAPEPTITFKTLLPAIEQLPVVSKAVKALVSLAKSMGLDTNQAALSAAQSLRTNYRVDVLGLLALPGLESPVQERHLTPTAIGKTLGMSARAFNLAMCEAGLQFKGDDGEWRPTDKGKPYAVYVDTLKKHHNGTPVQQLRWLESVTGVMALDSHRVWELVPKLN